MKKISNINLKRYLKGAKIIQSCGEITIYDDMDILLSFEFSSSKVTMSNEIYIDSYVYELTENQKDIIYSHMYNNIEKEKETYNDLEHGLYGYGY